MLSVLTRFSSAIRSARFNSFTTLAIRAFSTAPAAPAAAPAAEKPKSKPKRKRSKRSKSKKAAKPAAPAAPAAPIAPIAPVAPVAAEKPKRKRSKQAKSTDALKPKRIPNAFFLFAKANWPAAGTPEAKERVSSTMQRLSKQWKELPADKRESFNKSFQENRQHYTSARQVYLKAEKERPKRPTTAYMEFVKENRQKIAQANPSLDARALVREIAKQWRELPEDTKARFTAQLQEAKQKFAELKAANKA